MSILRPPLMIPLAFLFLGSVLFSCKDKKLIDQKNHEISLIIDSIKLQESQLLSYSKATDSQLKEKEMQETNNRLYADSAKAVTNDSPVATLYIKENRQNVSDLVDKYVEAHRDSLAGAVFAYQLGLIAYGMSDSNQEIIRYVEAQTDRFDAQIKNSLSAISNINSQISELETKTDYCKEQIIVFNSRTKQLEQEIKELSD